MLGKRSEIEGKKAHIQELSITNPQTELSRLKELKIKYQNYRIRKYGNHSKITPYYFPETTPATGSNSPRRPNSQTLNSLPTNQFPKNNVSIFDQLNSDLSINEGSQRPEVSTLIKIGFLTDAFKNTKYDISKGQDPPKSSTFNTLNIEKQAREIERHHKNVISANKKHTDGKTQIKSEQPTGQVKPKKGEFNMVLTPRMSIIERKRIKVSREETVEHIQEIKDKVGDKRKQGQMKLVSIPVNELPIYKQRLIEEKYDEAVGSVLKNQRYFQRTEYESNMLKLATLAAKVIRKSMTKSKRSNREFAVRAKKLHREMLVYWKRKNKEFNELRKKKEKLELEMKRKEEEKIEQTNQMKRIEYLITQSAFYAEIMASKLGSQGEPRLLNEKIIELDDEDKKRAENAVMDIIRGDRQRVKDMDSKQDKDRPDKTNSGQRQFDQGGYDFSNVNLTTESKLVEVPVQFHGSLKEYQLKGLRWLDNLYEQGINGILADEMGLGKTIQALALLAHISESKNNWGPFLVIAPSTTLYNWHTETKRFCPELKVLPYWGGLKQRKYLRRYMQQQYLGRRDSAFHVVITSYQIAVLDERILQRLTWNYVILDEAQAIKNIKGQRWNTLLSIRSRNKLLLTGTPIQNTMAELWALLHFIMPKLFDSHEQFQEWFSKDIEAHSQNKQKLNQTQLDRLHAILKPFMLRRVKKDVEKEIGQKHEYEILCNLTSRQRVLYEKIRSKICISDFFALRENKEKAKNLMNLVMQFRKVCNHPDLFERKMVRSGFVFSRELLSYSPPHHYLGQDGWIIRYDGLQSPFCQRLPVVIEDIQREGHTLQKTNHLLRQAYWDTFLLSGESVLQFDFWYNCDMQSLLILLANIHYIRKYKRNPISLLSNKSNKNHKIIKSISKQANEVFFYLRTSIMDLSSLFIETVIAQPAQQIKTKRFKDDSSLFWKSVSVKTPNVEFPTFVSLLLDSSKLTYLDSLLLKLKSENKRCLVFCQMTKMMDILEEFLQWRQYRYFRLDGSCNLSSRRDMVREYQRNGEIFVFLLSTRAGGLGVTLTAADVVIFYDNDWNPTMDAQAADRAHRIGRTKDVEVYRLISKDTIEDKIVKRAHQKKCVQQTVYSGEAFKGNVFKTNDILSILFDEKEITMRKEMKKGLGNLHPKRTGRDTHHSHHIEEEVKTDKKEIGEKIETVDKIGVEGILDFEKEFEADFEKDLEKLLGADFE